LVRPAESKIEEYGTEDERIGEIDQRIRKSNCENESRHHGVEGMYVVALEGNQRNVAGHQER